MRVTAVDAFGDTQSSTRSVTVVSSPRPTVSIALTTVGAAPRVNTAVSFTVTAVPAGSNAITSTTINFGDGTSVTLAGAAVSVQHVYTATGSYTVTATVTDESGETGSGSTVISVVP